MKSYTDLEQSKVLANILPLESADMYWMNGKIDNVKQLPTPHIIGNAHDEPLWNDFDVPCWSLAALLGVLPQSITKYIESERCQKTFHLNLFRSYYYCCSYSFASSISDNDGNNTLYCVGRDNWVDACYEMIIKIKRIKCC